MKKVIIILFIISSLFLLNNKKNVVIPKDSIRYRIVANSNSFVDQKQKKDVNDAIMPEIIKIMSNSNTIGEARNNINESLPNIEKKLAELNINYELKYGYNYFPEKRYKDVIYQENNYESLVIKLGESKGNNWWCVIFPPLCLLEISENEKEDINYSFYIKDIINKYS